MINMQPNRIQNSYSYHTELKEYSIWTVMTQIETFLNFIFLIYTANAVTETKCLADDPPSFSGTLYINDTCNFLKFQWETFSKYSAESVSDHNKM